MSTKKTWLVRVAAFLSVVGPGIITGSVDNDAGGITTYSVAGALYGYSLLWTLLPAFVALFVVQEMNCRMGIVTKKGLADLIRESFGVKATFLIFLSLVIADIGNTATEFAGIAGSLQVFGISKYASVPLSAIAVWFLVSKGTYRLTERIFLIFSMFLMCYVVSAIMARPDWNAVNEALRHPQMPATSAGLQMVIGMIGTTIAPWMQFYMQAAVIEKNIRVEEYRFAVIDVLLGCVATVVVAFFIIVACAATMHAAGIEIVEAKDAAVALRPLAGAFASVLFAFGLFIASIFSAAILPIATSFYICEAFGFEAGVDKTLDEAPQFYVLFAGIILIACAIILFPGAPLIKITLWTQVINGLMLPVVLVSMMLMVNDREIMGEWVNGRVQNIVGWATITTLIVLTAAMFLWPVITSLGLIPA